MDYFQKYSRTAISDSLSLFRIAGTKSGDSLCEKLKAGIWLGDEENLRNIVNECVDAGMSELNLEICRARNLLQYLNNSLEGLVFIEVKQFENGYRSNDYSIFSHHNL